MGALAATSQILQPSDGWFERERRQTNPRKPPQVERSFFVGKIVFAVFGSNPQIGLVILALFAGIGAAVWWLPAAPPTQTVVSGVVVPELIGTAQTGQLLFVAKCGECYGSVGQGTANGPPLIHRIYEPGHHGDEAFQRAVKLGVRAHHWNFGDMPKVDGVNRADVENILAFARTVQRHNGID